MPSLLSAINAAASALDAEHVRMEVAVSNMANANSTGGPGGAYRRRMVSLESVPDAEFSGTVDGASATGVRVASVTEDPNMGSRFDPTHPDANAQGFVAEPNVDVQSEMVDMVTAARAYQANLSAIGLIRDTIQRALELGK